MMKMAQIFHSNLLCSASIELCKKLSFEKKKKYIFLVLSSAKDDDILKNLIKISSASIITVEKQKLSPDSKLESQSNVN